MADMMISELIRQLSRIIKKNGDMPVKIFAHGSGMCFSDYYDIEKITIARDDGVKILGIHT